MQETINVGILGATGSVGQKFIEVLNGHPWFKITALCASERSAGKYYKDAANWFQTSQLPEEIGSMLVRPCKPDLDCRIVFSGLDSSVAGPVEEEFARAGYIVVSNSKNHRMDENVPLLVPEINAAHLSMIKRQSYGNGMIITNPNCSTIGLVMALKPLVDAFGVQEVSVVTLQALSGAGYPGVASLDIIDNVVPYIGDEEDKIENEPLKIFGDLVNDRVEPAVMKVSATCNRVASVDGHLECVSLRLGRNVSEQEIINAWRSFSAEPQAYKLPTAPEHPIYYFDEPHHPQPKKHRMLDKGMAVSIGRLRPCPILDWKFTLLSHNTIRGAAGGAVLNAELLVKKNLI